MPQVNIEGVGTVNFPDDMPHDAIQHAIETDILPKYKAPPANDAGPSFVATLKRAAGNLPLVGAAETAANFGTSMAGMAAGGNAAIAQGAGQQVEDAAKAGNPTAAAIAPFIAKVGDLATRLGIAGATPTDTLAKIGSAATYQPRSASGQTDTALGQKGMEVLGNVGDAAGEKVADVTGSPAAGAAANAAVQFLAPALLGGAVHAGGAAAFGDRGIPAVPGPDQTLNVRNVTGQVAPAFDAPTAAPTEAVPGVGDQGLSIIQAIRRSLQTGPNAPNAGLGDPGIDVHDVASEQINAAPPPSEPVDTRSPMEKALWDATAAAREAQSRVPSNIDVAEQNRHVTNIEAAPPPAEAPNEPFPPAPPPNGIDVHETPNQNIVAQPRDLGLPTPAEPVFSRKLTAANSALDYAFDTGGRTGDMPAGATEKPQETSGELPTLAHGENMGADPAKLQAGFDAVTSRTKGALPTRVVAREADLPPEILQKAAADGARPGDIEAVYHDGQVWMVADAMKDPVHAAMKWMHEQVGHNGVRSVFDLAGEQGRAAFNKYLDDVTAAYDAGKFDKWFKDPADRAYLDFDQKGPDGNAMFPNRRLAAEEFTARLAEFGANDPSGYGQRLRILARNALRRIPGLGKYFKGITLDEVSALLAKARRGVESGPGGSDVATRFSLAGAGQNPQRERMLATPEFRRWFAGSKVVDEAGKPLQLYHGTTRSFNVFDPTKGNIHEQGVFLTPDPGFSSFFTRMGVPEEDSLVEPGNVMPVYASLKNPKVMDFGGRGFDYARGVGRLIEGAKARGYDGLVLKNIIEGDPEAGLPTDQYVAFRPEQIKSSIGNNGEFDATNRDIRYARRADSPLAYPADEVAQRVRASLKRKLELGGPVNAGKTFKDAAGKLKLGAPDADYWIKKTESILSPEEIKAARQWYAEVHSSIAALFPGLADHEVDRITTAYLASNKNVSPEGALMNAMRVRERYKGMPLEPGFKKAGLSEDVLNELFGPSGQASGKGIGVKLSDFIDSALSKDTRTYMGNHAGMGAPFVVDVHSARDMGYVDWTKYRYLVNRFGQKAVDKAGIRLDMPISYDVNPAFDKRWKETHDDKGATVDQALRSAGLDPADESKVTVAGRETSAVRQKGIEAGVLAPSNPHVTEVQYEHAARLGRELTAEINKKGYLGGDLTPAEVQAIGWTAQAKLTGARGFDTVAAGETNTHRVSFEIAPGEGSAYAQEFGSRIAALPDEAKLEVTKRIGISIVKAVREITGGFIKNSFGEGAWMADRNPSGQMRLVGTQEAAKAAAEVAGYLGQQTEVWQHRPASGGKSIAFDIKGDPVSTPDRAATFYETMRETNSKDVVGFAPLYDNSGAYVGMRILLRNAVKSIKGVSVEEARARAIDGIVSRIEKAVYAASEKHGNVEADYGFSHVNISENDWSADPNGQGYTQGLVERYGPSIQGRLDRWASRVRSEYEAALGEAERSGSERDAGEPPAEPAAGDSGGPVAPTRFSLRQRYKDAVKSGVDTLDAVMSPLGSIRLNRDENTGKWTGGLSVHELPLRKEYLQERQKTMGTIDLADRAGRLINDAFSAANPAARKEIYDYLTTPGSDPSTISEAGVRALAVRTKRMIDKIGDDLVAQGLLDQTSRDAYKDQYLPRMYLRYLLDEGDYRALGSGKTASSMGYLKQRKDIPEDIRRVILGEVKDPGFLASSAIARPARDMALLKWLDSISTRGEWVAPNATMDWRGRTVTPEWMKSEASQLRRQAQHYESDADRLSARQMAHDMDDAADAELGKRDLKGDLLRDYKQIPDTPRYGRLRGLLVRSEIYDDIVGLGQTMPADPGFFMNVLGLGGRGTTLMNAFKVSKVTLNPPTQIRNFVSNAVLLQMSGVPLHSLPKLYVRAISEMAHDGPYWKLAQKQGLGASTFAANELMKTKTALLQMMNREKTLGPLGKLHLIASKTVDLAGNAYQWSESVGKLVKMIDGIERERLAPEDAVQEAQKWLFDYSLVGRNVKFLRSNAIGVPFITYQYKVLPRLVETALLHPQRLLPWAALFYGWQFGIAAALHVDYGDIEKLKKALPEWLQSRGHALMLPTKDEHGRWKFLDMSYLMPWSSWYSAAYDAAHGDLSGVAKDAGLFGGPVSSIATAMTTNKDPFTGRDIINNGDPPQAQLMSLISYVYSLMAPPWLSEHGFFGKALDRFDGTVNKKGEPTLSDVQTALRLVGVNVYPINPEDSRNAQMRTMVKDIQDTLSRLRTKASQESDPARRQAVIDKYRNEANSRSDALRKYETDSTIPEKLR